MLTESLLVFLLTQYYSFVVVEWLVKEWESLSQWSLRGDYCSAVLLRSLEEAFFGEGFVLGLVIRVKLDP